jgi:splicing factor 4
VLILVLYALVDEANIASFKAPVGLHRSLFEQKSNYQTPASALYGAYEGSSSQGSSSYGIHGFLILF